MIALERLAKMSIKLTKIPKKKKDYKSLSYKFYFTEEDNSRFHKTDFFG